MYVRKKDKNRVFWRGIVRAGDRVPDAVALANPGMFEWVEDVVVETPVVPAVEALAVENAWTMTDADLEDDEAEDVEAEDVEAESAGHEEPFDGYDEMSVRRIVEALHEMALSAEELLYVRDYEATHKGRSTMLREIDEMVAAVSNGG